MSTYSTHVRKRVLALAGQGFDVDEISRLVLIPRKLVLDIEMSEADGKPIQALPPDQPELF